MTQSSPQSGNSPASPGVAAGPDTRQDPAMRSLYRMSRTAGVGNQDYAAVNVLAVIGALLGVASFLVLIFNDAPLMLALPLIGIVVSAVAFWQIRRSNGTQTGGLAAVAGILFAGFFLGVNVYGRATQVASDRRHETALRTLVGEFEANLLARETRKAYDQFDTRFQDGVSFESFDRTMRYYVENRFNGRPIVSIELGDRVFVNTDENGITTAAALLRILGDGKTPDGRPYQVDEGVDFRLVDGVWKIRAIPNWFDAGPARRAANASSGA